MKINTKNTFSKKKAGLIVVGVALICAGLLYYTETSRLTNFITNPFDAPTATELEAQKTELATQQDPTAGNKSNVPTATDGVDLNKTTDQIPTAPEAAITITQLEQKNGQVSYAAQVSGIAENGTCSATFTKDGSRPIVRSSQASGATCGPISISETEFSQVGSWTLTLRYFADNKQIDTTKDIQI